jgi:hypothetical protein
VNLLRNNPKFSEGERKDLARRFSIDPEMFDTPEAYQSRLAGISNALKMKLLDAEKTIADSRRDKQDRDHALDLQQKLPAFLKLLGADQKVTQETPQAGSGWTPEKQKRLEELRRIRGS